MTSRRDTLFANPREVVDGFCFDQPVVDVFPDMIKRSVPGYATIIHMIGQLAARYAQANSHCYDLGCSLGAGLLAMRQHIDQHTLEIIGVDNAKPMIARCQRIIDADPGSAPVRLLCADIMDVTIERASVVVLNFTLQFLPLDQRDLLLQRISRGMLPGGILILSEKLRFENPEHDLLMTELHHDFKRQQGYSDLEVAQKRAALENVLIPETFATHQARLLTSGFSQVDLWFQCFNFASMLAFRR